MLIRFETLESRRVFASLMGSVWIDQNGSFDVDAADQAVPSALVWIDSNRNATLDAGEPQTQSDADGKYAFIDLPAGDYAIHMQPTPGLFQTSPAQTFGFRKDSSTEQFSLAEVDTHTGAVTDLVPQSPLGLRHGVIKTVQGEFYAAGVTTNNFFRIDLGTGNHIKIGSTGKTIVAGLAYDPIMDTIYTLARESGADLSPFRLYEVNRQTAELTRVGTGDGMAGIGNTSALTFDTVNREIILFENGRNEIIAYDLSGNARVLSTFVNGARFFNLGFDGHRFLSTDTDDQGTTLYEVDVHNATLTPIRPLEASMAVDALDSLSVNQPQHVTLQTSETIVAGINFLTNRINLPDSVLQIDVGSAKLVSASKGYSVEYAVDDQSMPVRFCTGTAASNIVLEQTVTDVQPIQLQTGPMDDRLSISSAPLIDVDMGAGRDTLVLTGAVQLTLADYVNRLRGIDVISLLNPGVVEFVSDAASIETISDARKLTVIVSPQAALDLTGDAWVADMPSLAGGRRVHQLALEDVILEIDNGLPWKNPLEFADVSRDGFVSALDALLIVNLLNSGGSRPLAVTDSTAAQAAYVDTNGDNFLSPLDALLVINKLNAR